ncbi:ParB/RepB/Spo0J family partition protein [Mucilaginibacter sp. Mucisp86]|uniref:ParB/RepB/Spo0J family partition protein n=1 Tax=Mucilaginibacter sp. Mucisp86 TaxID=3243060 RepID=UPI0039B6E2BE
MTTIAKKTKTVSQTKSADTKKNRTNGTGGKKKETIIVTAPATPVQPVSQIVKRGDIDFSPLQYRKYYSEKALLEFAEDLKQHGILHALTVRQTIEGRYELVAGERRLRGAEIAGLEDIPVVVRELTDIEVREIQLSENMHRENPHPMNEAQQIGEMQLAYKSVDEVAGRLGKSKQFVYSRIKLLSLIEPLREMFIADAIRLQEALEIAVLSDESQQQFYNQNCQEWREDADFELSDLKWTLNRYKANLKNAPFNTEDETLLPNMGACTNCPFNSASLSELFPDLAKAATCDNKQCYQNKCGAHQKRLIVQAFESDPQALIFDFQPTEDVTAILETIPAALELPQFFRHQVHTYTIPQEPIPDYFRQWNEPQNNLADEDNFDDDEYGDEEFEDGDEQTNEPSVTSEVREPVFDEEAYQEALEEYRLKKDDFDNQLANGNMQRGVYFSRNGITIIFFMENTADSFKNIEPSREAVTAKAVKEAEKQGNITVALYDGEIERLRTREKRAKEIDSEKFQLDLHKLYIDFNKEESNAIPTDADQAAAKLIIFNSLGWSGQRDFAGALGITHLTHTEEYRTALYEALQNLSDTDYRYLIRIALGRTNDVKHPNTADAYFLLKVSEEAGVNVAALKKTYAEKTAIRESKMETKIFEVERKKEILTKKDEVLI